MIIAVLYRGKLDLTTGSRNRLLGYVVRFALINLLYGLKANVDNMAHLGGLVTGLIIGLFLAHGTSLALDDRLQQGRKVLINAAVVLLLIFVPVARAKSYAAELAKAEDALHQEAYNAAVEHLKRYISSRPDDAYGHALLGYAFQELDREDDALSEFQRGLSLEPDYPFIQINLARIYVHREQFKAAVPLFRKGLLKINDDPDAFFQYGLALQQTGELEEAEKALQRCVGMEDENVEAHSLLAEVLKAEGKSELALRETNYVVALEKKKHDNAHE